MCAPGGRFACFVLFCLFGQMVSRVAHPLLMRTKPTFMNAKTMMVMLATLLFVVLTNRASNGANVEVHKPRQRMNPGGSDPSGIDMVKFDVDYDGMFIFNQFDGHPELCITCDVNFGPKLGIHLQFSMQNALVLGTGAPFGGRGHLVCANGRQWASNQRFQPFHGASHPHITWWAAHVWANARGRRGGAGRGPGGGSRTGSRRAGGADRTSSSWEAGVRRWVSRHDRVGADPRAYLPPPF